MRIVCFVLCLVLAGCGLDYMLFGEITRGDHVEVPGAGINTVRGEAPGYNGVTVAVFTGSGAALEGFNSVASGDAGRF